MEKEKIAVDEKASVAESEKRTSGEEEMKNSQTKKQRVETAKHHKVAIIVPFRDLHEAQKRKQHLRQFAPYMTNYLEKVCELEEFHIYVIEQSNDGRKFNRGKLLNIGFQIALSEGCEAFIFHDVDLLPQPVIAQWYKRFPTQPLHIARCWDRYNSSQTYIGGIVSIGKKDFELIDGFPNIYWGWGGEDDELSKRFSHANVLVDGPSRSLKDGIVDLEDMTLGEKLALLKREKAWKCEMKWEVNDEHENFRNNPVKPSWWGLKGMTFTKIKRNDTDYGEHCSIITVDIQPTYDHWTNSA